MELFSRNGSEPLSLFSSNSLGDAAQQVGLQAQLLANDATLVEPFSR